VRRSVALASLLLLTAACATVGATVADACPESRALRCATPPACTFDRARGCRVCGCEPWDPAPTARSEAAGRAYQPEEDPATGRPDLGPPAR